MVAPSRGNETTRCCETQQPRPRGHLEAGDFAAISRWLSAATPPEKDEDPLHPGRDVSLARNGCGPLLASLPGCEEAWCRDRWCRCAQPPANGFHPSGIGKGMSAIAGFSYNSRCGKVNG